MSRFLSEKYHSLRPYVPGEQPQDKRYVKLNTNESPYPPSPGVQKAAESGWESLRLYPDPDCRSFREKLSRTFGLEPENYLVCNGSDEALSFIIDAFGDSSHPFYFPDITYGFYPIFCQKLGVPYEEIPLQSDFTLNIEDYPSTQGPILLANPNAPTGLALEPASIEKLLRANPERLIVVDEAYVDFGAGSCLGLISRYDNLLVVQTFSKSRSLAGARLGFAAGNGELIADLNALRCSFNPYNVNRVSLAVGEAALEDNDYYLLNCEKIIQTREQTAELLKELGFTVLPSQSNFLFIRHETFPGETLYLELKKQGVLVRHFTLDRIKDFNRVSIGTPEDMRIFLDRTREILYN